MTTSTRILLPCCLLLDPSERMNEAATLASLSGRGFLLDPPASSPQAAQRLEKSPCDALPDVHTLGGPSRLGVVKAIRAARPAAVCSALTPVSRPHKTHTLQVFFFFSGESGMGGQEERKHPKNDGNDKEEKSAVLGNQVIRLRGQEVRLARPLFPSNPDGWSDTTRPYQAAQ